jgi:hypothetical protein
MEAKMAKYELTVQNGIVTTAARDLDEMIQLLEEHVAFLKALKAAGAQYAGGLENDRALFETDDRRIAICFGFRATDPNEDDLPSVVSHWGWYGPAFVNM